MKFEPGTKVGPYQILGELGRGGMATVYRAYQPNLEREVAIKVLPEFLVEQPGFKTRFHREAVAVARLQHPNILSVFDHGEQDGVTYIVSEYVEGGTLAQRMGAPIQLDYCVRILRPIADALDYAHSEGVIHRDVKPSNILLDRRGVPILSDFGLARVAQGETERLTQTGAMVGTPTYMAPEQCSGGEVGAAADTYALAVIAFEMMTGRVPFTAANPLGVIAAHQMMPPPSPRKFNPSLPASIEQPLLAALAKDPARRPETATDFVDTLAAAIPSAASQYPMTPPPVSPVPATQMPPTPTAIEPPQTPYPSAAIVPVAPVVDPAPSAYPAAATPPPSAPQYAPNPAPPAQYTPPPSSPGPFSPPPYAAAPQSNPPAAPSPYAAPAPYAVASATPPPSYPPPAQQQYSPPPVYMPAQQWVGPQPARREGVAGWVLASLWVGVALGALIAIAAAITPFTADLDDTARSVWVALGLAGAIAGALSLAAVLGLAARDRWAPMAGWGSVAALAVSVAGIPVAALVGWGLAQAPKGTLVAPQAKPGGGMRAGAPLIAGAVLVLVLTGTTIVGWSGKTSPTPVATITPIPQTGCKVVQPDTAMNSSSVGSDCGFRLGAAVAQLDCATTSTLPAGLDWKSYDDQAGQFGGAATMTQDGRTCHLTAPYNFDAQIRVPATIAGDTFLAADFVPAQSTNKVQFGFSYRCDSTGCLQVSVDFPSGDLYMFDDSKTLIDGQSVVTRVGVNRLVVVTQGLKIRVWLNGVLVATQSASRDRAGNYKIYMWNLQQGQSIQGDVLKFSIFNLK